MSHADAPRPGFIVPQIEAHLSGENIAPDSPLALMRNLHTLGEDFLRQFVEQRRERSFGGTPADPEPVDIYVTDITHRCVRKVAYKVWGHHADEKIPLEPRTRLKFWFGDVIEAGVFALASLAGLEIAGRQHPAQLVGASVDGAFTVRGRIDAILLRREAKMAHLVECKSMTGMGFKKFKYQGPDDEWGYRTQTALYESAAIEYAKAEGLTLGDTIFLAISTDTGHMAEAHVPSFDTALTYGALERARTAYQARDIEAADALPRLLPEEETKTRQKNKVKFEESTGRTLLSKQCSYCEFRKVCWPNAQMELKSGRPLFVVSWPVGEDGPEPDPVAGEGTNSDEELF